MHSIAYDEVHDEIFVTQPFSEAILAFRGGANGEEAPIRVIQGPLTQIHNYVDQLAIDPVHNELFVPAGYPDPNRVLVFSRDANGNVAPIRILEGPDALRGVSTVAVDPVHDLLLASGKTADGAQGVMIFDRTAQGNAKPRGVISGLKAIGGGGRIFAYPPKGEIIVIGNGGGGGGAPSGGFGSELEMGNAREGFVSVWSIEDRGDVAPRRWKLGGPKDRMRNDPTDYGQIMGAGVDPKNKSVMISSKTFNAIFTYSFPEIF